MTRMRGDVGYDEDVRPLFLAEDRARLRATLDLWSFPEVRQQARSLLERGSGSRSPGAAELLARWIEDGCPKARARKYSDFFSELDSWTEYWDIYRPETRGLYYFGDTTGARGYLSAFLPSPTSSRAPTFDRWKVAAVLQREPGGAAAQQALDEQLQEPVVREALVAVDELVCGLVAQHFRGSDGTFDSAQYLDAVEWFAVDALPLDPDRFERVPADDERKRSSMVHTMGGEVMWFAWAAHVECTARVLGPEHPRRALHAAIAAGVALGCSMDFVFRNRCRTRSEYRPEPETRELIRSRATAWCQDFDRAAAEVRDLFRIREYGTL